MNTSLINETNSKLNEIIERLKSTKNEYEAKLARNKSQIDDELAKVDEYKNLFYEAKKKIQKMSDDINGFEEDYRNLVERFQDDELCTILTGVSKEINAKIKEKKRNIQKDQEDMNALVDQAQEAKKSLVKLTTEKRALELVLRQVTDVYKYYEEEFEKIASYTQEHFDNLHPDEDVFEVTEDINTDDIEIDEKVEIVTDEEIENDNLVEDVKETETEEDEVEEESEEVTDEETTEDEEEIEAEEEEDENIEAEKDVETKEEETEPEIDFDVDNIVINDDLEDEEEESIKSFLNKDENNFDEE